MDYKNGQNLRKNLNANVLQIFAFAFHIVGHNVKDKPKWTPKFSHNVSGILLTMSKTNLDEDAYWIEVSQLLYHISEIQINHNWWFGATLYQFHPCSERSGEKTIRCVRQNYGNSSIWDSLPGGLSSLHHRHHLRHPRATLEYDISEKVSLVSLLQSVK